jgi:anti-anti-sigma regulatory factor
MKSAPVAVKRLPDASDQASQKRFLRDIKEFVRRSTRPRLILDLSSVEQIKPESVDLLLECVDHAERGDGEVFIAGASARTTVILELTQAASVVRMVSSVREATDEYQPDDFATGTQSCFPARGLGVGTECCGGRLERRPEDPCKKE